MNWVLVMVAAAVCAEITALIFRLLHRDRRASFALAASAAPWLVPIALDLWHNPKIFDYGGAAIFIAFPAGIIAFALLSLRELYRFAFWFGWVVHALMIFAWWLFYVHWNIAA